MIPLPHSTSLFPIVQCQLMQHNNKNSELYLHDRNITALQERQTHDNYSNLVIHADNSERAPRSIIRHSSRDLEPGAFAVWRRTEADTKKKWTAGVTDNGRYSQPSTSYLRVWTINWRQVDFRVEKSRCNCVFQIIRLRDWLYWRSFPCKDDVTSEVYFPAEGLTFSLLIQAFEGCVPVWFYTRH